MNATQIGWAGLVGSFALVAIAIALSFWQRLHLTRSILWASARAAVQLLLVALRYALCWTRKLRCGGGGYGLLS